MGRLLAPRKQGTRLTPQLKEPQGLVRCCQWSRWVAIGFVLGLMIGYALMGIAQTIIQTSNDIESIKIASRKSKNTVHILATSNGSPYQNYQMRIAYASYNLIKKMPGGERHVGFTRILHRTADDELMNEIPTFRADPLQPDCDEWCEYPVSDRANAVMQFFEAAKRNPYLLNSSLIYMIESDYVFMKPLELPKPLEMKKRKAWGFEFTYISPSQYPDLMSRLYPNGAPSKIPSTGPAPVLMQLADWLKVTPDWERLSSEIEQDQQIKSELGWVREMYGFSAALALQGIDIDLSPPPQNRFITQLPLDEGLGNAHAFHYTFCTIYRKTGAGKDAPNIWEYDKRNYVLPEDALRVPKIENPPKWENDSAWQFVEGPPVTQTKHVAIESMIKQMNKAIQTLPTLESLT